MPDLFSPYTLKGVTLRNRIAMSPMTMYRSTDGMMGDYHVMLMGSRAAGGFGLVFPEQIAITPDGAAELSRRAEQWRDWSGRVDRLLTGAPAAVPIRAGGTSP